MSNIFHSSDGFILVVYQLSWIVKLTTNDNLSSHFFCKILQLSLVNLEYILQQSDNLTINTSFNTKISANKQ